MIEDNLRYIQDAGNLLEHFDKLKSNSLPTDNLEVLKRAGLIVAMTAWETYVEVPVRETAEARLQRVSDTAIAALIKQNPGKEIKKLHNPSSDKALQLFKDYANADLAANWRRHIYDFDAVRGTLNKYVKLRGDIVHKPLIIAE